MKQKKKLLIGGAAAVIILVMAVLMSIRTEDNKLTELLDLGAKYLDEMDYEAAIATFDEAIAIDPKCEEAYLGKANAQYFSGNIDLAIETLTIGIEQVDDPAKLESRLNEFLEETAESTVQEQMNTAVGAEAETEELEAIDFEITNIPAETSGNQQDIPVIIQKTSDGNQTAQVNNDYKDGINGFLDYIYYSGDVVIPESLTYEGKDVSVTRISSNSFKWSIEMQSITIPASVNECVEVEPFSLQMHSTFQNPFMYCSALKEIIVEEGNKAFKSIDGVLYSNDGKELIAYPAGRDGSSFTIPKNVEFIWDGAFVGCKNLENIQVESGNVKYESKDGVLVDKTSQILLTYPAGKKDNSYIVPEGIKTIEKNAFYANELEEIDCGENVKVLNDGAIFQCFNLKSVKLHEVETVNYSKIKECPSLEIIEAGIGTKSIWTAEIYYNDNPWTTNINKLNGILQMQNLETLGIMADQIEDFSEIKSLTKLKELTIVLWNADTFVDLTPLLELENLSNVDIFSLDRYSFDYEGLNEEMQNQIEELKEKKPNCSFYID